MIATTIEQSKKLIELGIDVNTTDMYYHKRYDGSYDLSIPSNSGFKNKHFFDDCPDEIPAWSLSALMQLMPSATLDSSNDHFYRLRCAEKFSEWHNNPIDAAFEMMCYLLKNKLI